METNTLRPFWFGQGVVWAWLPPCEVLGVTAETLTYKPRARDVVRTIPLWWAVPPESHA